MQTIISNNHIMPSTNLQSVIIGMGFSKKTSALKLTQTLKKILQTHQYQVTDIALPAFKQNDPNILEFKKLTTIPIHLITQERLLDLQPKCSSFSKITYHHTGLGAVAEACALALIHKNGHLLIPKIIYNGISFSIAIKGYIS